MKTPNTDMAEPPMTRDEIDALIDRKFQAFAEAMGAIDARFVEPLKAALAAEKGVE